MATAQVKNGKAFEYALLMQFKEKLSAFTQISVSENDDFDTAERYFLELDCRKQAHLRLTSSFAVNFLMDLEPRLKNALSDKDILLLALNGDAKGQSGDVRDVLTIRSLQKWEIGISAKHNHKALKHSRLSAILDFGEKWLGMPCSSQYFTEIKPVFDDLSQKRESGIASKWADCFKNVHKEVYLPILSAFKDELNRLYQLHPTETAQRLLEYVIGREDFYKVISKKDTVEIQAYNLHGTLSSSFVPEDKNEARAVPIIKIPKLKLPTQILGIQSHTDTTLMVFMDNGWQISFRLHTASSKIESSLKFDIQLVSSPSSLFSNTLKLK